MAARAGIVVTGTEVLTGRVPDANGPWLAEQLRQRGVDVGRIVVVGDRPDDLAASLRFLLADHDLVITTGGLGPTADDLTARIVADVQGRGLELDP
ncbi:MAG: molybdopterin-binding protein, partial [Nocardioides sp.]